MTFTLNDIVFKDTSGQQICTVCVDETIGYVV